MLCAEEVDRSCAPWGLLAEDKQATLIAGIEVARRPCAADRRRRDPLSTWRARSRRGCAKRPTCCTPAGISPRAGPIHPRQQQVIDDLAAFARPYLSRLWARLHGRDVWQEPCDDVDDVRSLLEGVARSVSLDHRQRIKAM